MKCAVCGTTTGLFEKHHIYPLCYGGLSQGPQIDICPSCHRLVHRVAESLSTKSHKHVNVTPEFIRQAAPYIKAIVKMKVEFQSGNRVARDGRNIVPLHLSSNTRRALQILKVDKGFSNVNDLITFLIMQELSKL